jgi:hypothetical protein
LGNRNDVEVFGGFLNAGISAGNLFVTPNGSDNTIHLGEFTENDAANLSVGFNVQHHVPQGGLGHLGEVAIPQHQLLFRGGPLAP